MRMISSAVLIFTVAVAACASDATGPLHDGLRVTTQQSSYDAGDVIEVTVANGTEWDAFFFHCDHRLSTALEMLEDGTWTQVLLLNGPACRGVGGIDVVLPGSSRITSVVLDQQGTFRFRYQTATRSARIGESEVISNVFTIE